MAEVTEVAGDFPNARFSCGDLDDQGFQGSYVVVFGNDAGEIDCAVEYALESTGRTETCPQCNFKFSATTSSPRRDGRNCDSKVRKDPFTYASPPGDVSDGFLGMGKSATLDPSYFVYYAAVFYEGGGRTSESYEWDGTYSGMYGSYAVPELTNVVIDGGSFQGGSWYSAN